MIGNVVQLYCCEDISKIYGYKEAIADKENYWDCHHCLGLVWSKEQLIEMGLYYNQPADRLMFVTKSQHHKLHATFNENIQKTLFKKGDTPWNKGLHDIIPWNKGKTGIYSEETRKKMSEAKRGNSTRKNKHHTEETKKKLSKALKGRKRGAMRNEHRLKISKAKKDKKPNEEARKKMSESQKNRFQNPEERNKRSKKVFQYTLNGEFVREWISLSEVKRQLGFSISGLSACCLGHRKSYKKYIWSYDPLHQNTKLSLM